MREGIADTRIAGFNRTFMELKLNGDIDAVNILCAF